MIKYNIYYNRTNTCDRCRDEGKETKLIPHTNAYREYNDEGNCTGRWMCRKCYGKYGQNSSHNTIKSLAYHRIGNLDPNCSSAKGDLFQELTCRWRSTVSTIPVEDLNKKLDNYNSPIDHSLDSELGIVQTKGRLYNSIDRKWGFGGLEREWRKEFDYEICYCANKDGNIIERIYIIPKKEIIDRGTSICIYKNPSRYVWYEQYRVKDEDILKKVNEIWKEIISNK